MLVRKLAKLPLVGNLLKLPPVVTVIRLEGVIGGGQPRRSLTQKALQPLLKKAFTAPGVQAVALSINSPGGSPAQSSLIAKEIRRQAQENELPVIAFVEDVAASGGYWLACAANEIYADENAVVGSIGVIAASFGLHDLIQRIGVERRIFTAGTNKSMLDTFRPTKEEDVERLETVLQGLHRNFIDQVKSSRGAKLAADDATLFQGDFWLAGMAESLGLIDGMDDLNAHMKRRFGEDVQLKPVMPKKPIFAPPWESRGSWPEDTVDALLATLDERTARARFGL